MDISGLLVHGFLLALFFFSRAHIHVSDHMADGRTCSGHNTGRTDDDPIVVCDASLSPEQRAGAGVLCCPVSMEVTPNATQKYSWPSAKSHKPPRQTQPKRSRGLQFDEPTKRAAIT